LNSEGLIETMDAAMNKNSEQNDLLLRVDDLKVSFRGRHTLARAVAGVSYQVGRQETVCLVGESGCGKTVSSLALMGLLPRPPAEIAGGRVDFGGRNLLTLGEEELMNIRGRQIAMVFQEPMTSLNPVFTIGDQIGEAIRIHEPVAESEIRNRSIQLLRDVGIPSPTDRLRDYPHQLSGGQRQRVMIAMALACNPELIIADEPTTALDVTVQAQILNLLNELKGAHQMSILYITHDLGVVAEIADRIYVMYAGIIVEEGRAADLFAKPGHPYTKGLLASLPDRRHRHRRLYSVSGTVPDPTDRPEGCPFHPRCPEALARCSREHPEMCDYGAGHLCRCPLLFGAWK
jgi:oligopeptide/dipeptide ABC transporter ATP-binding protein